MLIHRSLLAAAAVAALAACAESGVVATEPQEVKAQPEVTAGAFVPAGTRLTVRMNEALGTVLSTPGQAFTATVVDPIRGSRGQILIPEGATLRGSVARVDTGASPLVALDFHSIQTARGWEDIQARILASEKLTYPGPDEIHDPTIVGYDAVFLGPVGGFGSPLGYYDYGFDYYDENAREIRIPRGAELRLQLTRPLQVRR